MKKIYLFLLAFLLLNAAAFAQVTGTKTIGVDYITLALAITALNTSGVGAGGATINVPAGYTETAPSGGYVLGTAALNATLSSANTLTIKKNGSGTNPLITAPVGTSTVTDGIFKLAGVDYVTIDGIDLKESAANTSATTAMECGYGFFNLNASAPFDGCNNNTIQNCTVTLNRTIATSSKSIYVIHTVPTSISALAPTVAADLHNNNKFYSNTLTNAIYGIYIGGIASANDQGNDIGGSSSATGNTINNIIGALYTSIGAVTATYQTNCNISNNNISNTANGGTASIGTCWGIYAYGPSCTFVLNNNTIALTETAVGAYSCYGIYGNASLANITATNNTVTMSEPSGSASTLYGIFLPNGNNTTITGNIITETQALNSTTYAVYISSTGTSAISSNIIKQVSGLASSAQFYSIVSAATGVSETISDNIFDNTNISVAGTSSIVILIYTVNATPDKTITGNTINGALTLNSSNTTYLLLNNASTGAGSGTVTIANNNFSNIIKTGTGALYGIFYAPTVASSQAIRVNNNTFNNLSVAGGDLVGIYAASGSADSICNNTLKGFSGAGSVYGIYTATPSTPNMKIGNNKLSGFTTSGTTVNTEGIWVNSGDNVWLFNNFIADLKATAASSTADAVCGIRINSATANSSIYTFYNSIYLNAASTGTNFSSSGIFHAASSTASTAKLSMINNIIVNTSTPSGTGITSAYRRATTDLDNFDASSNNNDLYVGTPSASRVIFYDGTNADQTLAAYKTRVGPVRDSAAVSVMPAFVSATDLHLTAAGNCQLDGYGIPVAGVVKDIDGDTRDAGAPDIGADEFTGTNSGVLALAGTPNSSVSVTKNVSPSGTVFITPACDIIAKLVPGTVSGSVKVQVTTDPSYVADPSYSFYNAAPYLRRHYDIEPATNAGTATGTVTLYFTNQEFVDYNTYNPLWPKLPTVAGGGNSDPNKANVLVTQYHGTPLHSPSSPNDYSAGTADVFSAPVVNYNGAYWEVSVPATGFSGFYAHTSYFAAPLPVTLNYLRGNRQGGIHHLSWSVTCASSPTAVLTLERSADGVHFAAIHTITATALECQQPFAYDDAKPMGGINYYRLKIADADGRFGYSNIINLVQPAQDIQLVNIVPNPTNNGNFKLAITSGLQTKMEIVITDMQGREAGRSTVTLTAGVNSIDMQQGRLAPGVYQLFGLTAAGRTKAIAFVRQ